MGVAPIHGDSSRVGAGGKQSAYLSSVSAESRMASRPCSVLSCSHPVVLVNSASLLGRGGEVEPVCVNEMVEFHQDELMPCVFIQSEETSVFCVCERYNMTKTTTESYERWF